MKTIELRNWIFIHQLIVAKNNNAYVYPALVAGLVSRTTKLPFRSKFATFLSQEKSWQIKNYNFFVQLL